MAKLNASTVALLSLFLGLAFFAGQPVAAHGGKKEAPRDTVKRVVAEAIDGNKGVGAALIRLVFHDCWVNVRSYTTVYTCIHACTNLLVISA
jgi:peroxidase